MTPTPSEINRRLAEFAGWTRIRPVQDGETVPVEETSGLFGLAPLGLMQWFVPDYYHSADAVLPLVERVCRERGVLVESVACSFGDSVLYSSIVGRIGFQVETVVEIDDQPTLPAAICLALVDVLDGDSKTNNERTEP